MPWEDVAKGSLSDVSALMDCVTAGSPCALRSARVGRLGARLVGKLRLPALVTSESSSRLFWTMNCRTHHTEAIESLGHMCAPQAWLTEFEHCCSGTSQ